jgi:hypothetical protein
MDKYLASSEYIDWEKPEVLAQAKDLASGVSGAEEITRRCFEFVREEIRHLKTSYRLLLCQKSFVSRTVTRE